MNNVIDFKAMSIWKAIPKEFQQKIIDNVFCSKCGNTTIVKYKINDDKQGIILSGQCIQCSAHVVRVVEND